MKKLAAIFAILALSLVLEIQALTPPPETGLASMYNDSFQDRLTSSKEKYNRNERTAAHRTLPFGTMVKVSRSDNPNKSTIVRINDKGPFYKGHIIELSRRAAEELGMENQGSVMVKIEVIEAGQAPPPPPPSLSNNEEKQNQDNPKEETPSRPTIAETNTNRPTETPSRPTIAETPSRPAETPSRPTVAETPNRPTETPSRPTNTPKPAAATPSPAPKTNVAKTNTAAEANAKNNNNQQAARSLAPNPQSPKPQTAKPQAAKPQNRVAANPEMEVGGLYKLQTLKVQPKGFGLQIAAFSEYESMLKELAELQKNWVSTALVYVDESQGKPVYKIILGPFNTKAQADSYAINFRKKFNRPSSFVVDLANLAQSAQANSVDLSRSK